MAVLKANAYGLGVKQIAKSLIEDGAERIGIAEVKEALEIRSFSDCPIQILGSLFKWEIPYAIEADIICPVENYQLAKAIDSEAKNQNKKVKVHILVDTGMGRLGIPHWEAENEINKCFQLDNLEIEGIYSHFANANDVNDPKTSEQHKIFKDLLYKLPKFPLVHMANSDAINNFPDTMFNMVRTGINLYGVFDLLGNRSYRLQPTLKLKTKLISKRFLKKGSTIGYGGTYTLPRNQWVGTIPSGYADGIPFYTDSTAKVIIGDEKFDIIGRVSMDYITVDLSDREDIKVGDTVLIFGNSKSKSITVEDWAKLKKSHPYDIICSLGNRVDRIYLSD